MSFIIKIYCFLIYTIVSFYKSADIQKALSSFIYLICPKLYLKSSPSSVKKRWSCFSISTTVLKKSAIFILLFYCSDKAYTQHNIFSQKSKIISLKMLVSLNVHRLSCFRGLTNQQYYAIWFVGFRTKEKGSIINVGVRGMSLAPTFIIEPPFYTRVVIERLQSKLALGSKYHHILWLHKGVLPQHMVVKIRDSAL